MARRAAALRAAKERKQKKIAIVGAVLLLGVLAFQAPRTLKLLNKPDATAAPPPAATAATPPALPAPTPGLPPAAAPPAGEFAAVDRAPAPAAGQLASFERFATKDPFAQQVVALKPGAPPPAAKREPGGAKAEAGPDSDKQVAPKPDTAKPGAPRETVREAPSAAVPVPNPTSAVVAVNGVRETVAPGSDFPSVEKIFTLVSLAPGSAKIGIAGGSLTGGAETVTLIKGKKLTLMNTADGTRYELVLVSLS